MTPLRQHRPLVTSQEYRNGYSLDMQACTFLKLFYQIEQPNRIDYGHVITGINVTEVFLIRRDNLGNGCLTGPFFAHAVNDT